MFYKRKTIKKMWVSTHVLWFFTFIIWLPLMWIYYYFVLIDATHASNHLIANYMFIMMGLFLGIIGLGIIISYVTKVEMLHNRKIYDSHKFMWKKLVKDRMTEYNKIGQNLNPKLTKRFKYLILIKTIFYQLIFAAINILVIVSTTISLQNISSVVVFNVIISWIWIMILWLNVHLIVYYWKSNFIHQHNNNQSSHIKKNLNK